MYRVFKERQRYRLADRILEMKSRVANVLGRLKEEKKISNFERHDHWSFHGRAGRSFTVWAKREVIIEPRSFGIYVDREQWNVAKKKHPNVAQFLFPTETNLETIERRILGLFQNSGAPVSTYR